MQVSDQSVEEKPHLGPGRPFLLCRGCGRTFGSNTLFKARIEALLGKREAKKWQDYIATQEHKA